MISVCMNLAMFCASVSSTAIASMYLIKKLTTRMIYLFLIYIIGIGLITSIPTCENGSALIATNIASGMSLLVARF